MSYLDATVDLYTKAAETPDVGLCCTTSPIWQFPGLTIPKRMQEMNYGCGTTVSDSDLVGNSKVLYVGVGGAMELLQFAYFSRQAKSIIGVDAVDRMLEAAKENLIEAASVNEWFDPSFIELRKGDALSLPVADECIDVAAQNCLFNIFKAEDLEKAVSEMYRILRPHGRLVMSDPICEQELSETLQ